MSSGDEISSRRTPKRKHKKLKLTMSVLTETPDLIPPVVGYFPSGYNPDAADQHSDDAPDVKLYRNKQRNRRMELVVKPKESNVEFVGSSYLGEAAGPQMCSYALGVVDREMGTLKIVPIAANKIFRLEPKLIKGPPADIEPSVEDPAAEKTGRGVKDLTSRYGTKKDKNRDKRWNVMTQQTNDASAREQLKEQIFDADVKDEDLKESKETTVPNIPPHDVSAVTPEKAYLLDEIIHHGEWDLLSDILVMLQSGAGDNGATFWEENNFPSFVINRIHRLREIKDEEKKKKDACIMTYITHLVNFRKLVGSSRRSQPNSGVVGDAIYQYNIPQKVCQKFMTLFVDPVSNVISTEKNELIIGYILVLTLFVDKFKTDPSDISKDLGMAPSQLKLYYLQLGCKSAMDFQFQKSFISLPVPLQLGQIKRRRKQKR